MTIRTTLTQPWLRALLGIAISIGFAAVTISRVDLAIMSRAWAEVSMTLLVLAAGLSLAELGVRAVRWRLLLSPLADVRYGVALGYLSIGHLANAILPARLGDIARGLLSGAGLGVSRASVLGTIAVERVADAGLLGAAVMVGVLIGFRELAPTLVAIAVAGTVAVTGALLIVVVLRRGAIVATRRGGGLLRHGKSFVAGADALRRPSSLAAVATLTLASFGLAVVILMTVATAVGLAIPVWQAALIISAVTLSTAIPAGPASIGTYEFFGSAVMVTMGFPPEQSLLCVALVHVVVVMPAAMSGLAAMWWMSIRPNASLVGGGGTVISERPA